MVGSTADDRLWAVTAQTAPYPMAMGLAKGLGC